MSVRFVLTRVLAVVALASAAACSIDTPTAPRLQPTAKPAADLCPGGYSVTDAKC
jgi:hypothetical protein